MSTEEKETELCQKCGMPKDMCECKGEVITVKHEFGFAPKSSEDLSKASKEDLEAKVKEMELIIESEALKTFKEERDALLAQIPEDRREDIKEFIGADPDKLEQIKGSIMLHKQVQDEPTRKVVKGKATLLGSKPETSLAQTAYADPYLQKYSDLYQTLRDPTASAEEKEEAETILNDVFAEITKGLKTRRRGDPFMLPTGVVSHCPKCGMVVEVDIGKVPCPYCGYNFGTDKYPQYPKATPK